MNWDYPEDIFKISNTTLGKIAKDPAFLAPGAEEPADVAVIDPSLVDIGELEELPVEIQQMDLGDQ